MRANVERPEIRRAVRARRDKHDLLSVPREGCLIVVRRTVGEPFDAGAVRLHPIKVRRAVALGSKRDPAAIGRPGRVVVDVRCARQRMLVAAVGIRDEQSDLFRDGKHPREEDLLRWRLRGCRNAHEENKADRDTDPHEFITTVYEMFSGGQKDTAVEVTRVAHAVEGTCRATALCLRASFSESSKSVISFDAAHRPSHTLWGFRTEVNRANRLRPMRLAGAWTFEKLWLGVRDSLPFPVSRRRDGM
jgi:hypothetical protein